VREQIAAWIAEGLRLTKIHRRLREYRRKISRISITPSFR